MKITIELPEKFNETLDLFCQTCKAILKTPSTTTIIDSPNVEKSTKNETAPQQPKQEKSKTIELPDDEEFAKLSLPEMEKIMTNPKNLSAFRFRAFARCARQVYDKKVEELAKSINPEGINGILKGKHKNQAARFISCVVNTKFPEEKKSGNDIEF